VHNDPDKSKQGYERFLCQNPLFDPNDQREKERSFSETDIDKNRNSLDQGIWPEFLGGYHMLHRLDGELFAVGVIDNTP